MMLEHFGEDEAAAATVRAIEVVLATETGRTADLKGSADTVSCGKAIAEAIG
jgi:tartrate dehydrogenase/decarboxylase/D-malate dehydrogenase